MGYRYGKGRLVARKRDLAAAFSAVHYRLHGKEKKTGNKATWGNISLGAIRAKLLRKRLRTVPATGIGPSSTHSKKIIASGDLRQKANKT